MSLPIFELDISLCEEPITLIIFNFIG